HSTVLVQQAGEGQVEDLQPPGDALAANLGGVRPWPSHGEGAELGKSMKSLAHIDKEESSPVLELLVQPSQAAQLPAEVVSAKATEEEHDWPVPVEIGQAHLLAGPEVLQRERWGGRAWRENVGPPVRPAIRGQEGGIWWRRRHRFGFAVPVQDKRSSSSGENGRGQDQQQPGIAGKDALPRLRNVSREHTHRSPLPLSVL